MIQPYIMSVFAAAAIAKITMVYPLPPITDIAANYRTLKVLSQRLGPMTRIVAVASIINAAVISRSMQKATERVHAKLAESSIYLN